MLGDDAPQLLVLDTAHRVIDSIVLFENRIARIAKSEKADFESSFLYTDSGKTYLVAVGSLSTLKRNRFAWIDLEGKKITRTTQVSLKAPEVAAPNIEGASLIDGQLVLANRANLTDKVNSLLVMKPFFSATTEAVHNIRIDLPAKSNAVGISGISYYKLKDLLLFTASTEMTGNAYADGTIGESYIGIISSASKQLRRTSIHPDEFIPLSSFLNEKSPQKIESVMVEKDEGKHLILHLAADNDNGQSTLFKMRWKL